MVQKVLQPRSARLSRRVRKSDRMMLSQQPLIRNLTGMESPLNPRRWDAGGSIDARTMPERPQLYIVRIRPEGQPGKCGCVEDYGGP
jgi:hypothetical protein